MRASHFSHNLTQQQTNNFETVVEPFPWQDVTRLRERQFRVRASSVVSYTFRNSSSIYQVDGRRPSQAETIVCRHILSLVFLFFCAVCFSSLSPFVLSLAAVLGYFEFSYFSTFFTVAHVYTANISSVNIHNTWRDAGSYRLAACGCSWR